MSASTPPPPTNGNGKYIALGILFLFGIVGLFVWKMVLDKPEQQVKAIPSGTASAPPANFNQAQVDEVPPPPPPEPDAGPVKKVSSTSTSMVGCEPKTCEGSVTSDPRDGASVPRQASAPLLRSGPHPRQYAPGESADQGPHRPERRRVRYEHRLERHGNVVGRAMRGRLLQADGHFPAPKGGCIDTVVPISFVPGGR